MNNGEQVAETGQTALQLPVMLHEPAGSRKARPYKEEMLGEGVVEVTVNSKPAGLPAQDEQNNMFTSHFSCYQKQQRGCLTTGERK